MIIAIDYDFTYTKDKDFWLWFIRGAHEKGHIVLCVTMRSEDNPVCAFLSDVVDVIYTSSKAKIPFMKKQGIIADIFIDDNPHLWFQDKQ
jgi:hypothetical protein